jgi:curved DNA-binding protein CbpA
MISSTGYYGVDLAAVCSAWRRLVRQHHPDLYGAEAEQEQRSTERVKAINNAYEQLKERLGRKRLTATFPGTGRQGTKRT